MENNGEEEVTINDVFRYMVNFKAEASANLKEEIKDLGGRMNGKIDDMEDRLEKKIVGIEDKIEEKMGKVRREMEADRNENKEMFKEMRAKMKKLEEDMMGMKTPSGGINTLKKMELEMLQKKEEEEKRKEILEKKEEEKKRKETIRKSERERERRQREESDSEKAFNLQEELARAAAGEKNWETAASSWLDEQVRSVNRDLRDEDKNKNKNKKTGRGMRRLKNWFGDTDSEESEEEDKKEDEDDWNMVGRKKKNEEKKVKAEMKKKKNRKKTTEKAKNIVGAGPMKKTSVEFFQNRGMNFEQAKMAVVKEYLKFYLQYEDEEITELSIMDTQIAQKDDVIYIAFEDFEDVKTMHSRAAACKNEMVQLRNFIPPQFHSRYMYLSKICADLRREDRSKKTQMRFNGDDVEVLIKDRGSEDPYKIVKLEDLCDTKDIPEYDHSLKWKVKKDKMRRVFTAKSPNRGVPMSLGGVGNQVHPLSRENSLENAPRKKIKIAEVTEDVEVEVMEEEEEEDI